MADYNTLYQQGLYLSPDQQDLLLAALSSNNPTQKQQTVTHNSEANQNLNHTPGHASSGSFSVSPPSGLDGSVNQSTTFGYEDSPYLDLNPDFDLEIGDLPPSLPSTEDYEPGDKRKDIDGQVNDKEDSGKKRRESDEKAAKKPGRKPLTSEPTSKRKAQNRAAQRAFRERKEKHLKDLEAKVEELQKASDNANQENGLLRAQVERLQLELKEYRKRLSWVTSTSGLSPVNAIPGAYSKGMYGLNNNEFMFDFPKFGDLPGSHLFTNTQTSKSNQNKAKDNPTATPRIEAQVPGVLNRNDLKISSPNGLSNGPSPAKSTPSGQTPNSQTSTRPGSGTLNGAVDNNGAARGYQVNSSYSASTKQATHDTPSSDSPSSSSDSHQSQLLSSNGTSPEPSLHSPAVKATESSTPHACTYTTINGEESFCAQLSMACGNINNPIPAVRQNSESASNTPSHANSSDKALGLDFFAQQNGGQFDPVLFGDWREPQDAILSQDFGTFFDDAFPLPDLGSPSHNFSEATKQPAAPKKDLIAEIDSKLDEDEEVVPGEDKSQMLTCNKIWDRLQSMEKFRNGEIDVDNLCSELRTKARCSEGGVVVNQKDVEDIMGRVK